MLACPACAVDEYNTSQVCHHCDNYLAKCAKTTEQSCVQCGLQWVRDVNSAQNILNVLRALMGTGERPEKFRKPAVDPRVIEAGKGKNHRRLLDDDDGVCDSDDDDEDGDSLLDSDSDESSSCGGELREGGPVGRYHRHHDEDGEPTCGITGL
jgi:hypothetical protein